MFDFWSYLELKKALAAGNLIRSPPATIAAQCLVTEEEDAYSDSCLEPRHEEV